VSARIPIKMRQTDIYRRTHETFFYYAKAQETPETQYVTTCYTRLRTRTESSELPKKLQMGMRFSALNAKSLHWSGSLKTVLSGLGNIILIYWRYRRSDETRVTLNKQTIIHCSVEN
jgi:hypothetical protein